MSEVLSDPDAIALSLRRVATEILERSRTVRAAYPQMSPRDVGVVDAAGAAVGPPTLPILVGIRRGGPPLAKRIAAHIEELAGQAPAVGAVDITLYRDDASTALPNPRIGPSRIPRSVDGEWVVLVDDVLHTGRTIRAALDALLDFGRPAKVELAVLLDRGGRQLPIQPDYVGLRVDVPEGHRVEVIEKRTAPGDEGTRPWAVLVPSRSGVPPMPRPSQSGDAGT